MKRVKEIIILWILVVSIVKINGQDLQSEDDKTVSLETTTSPPLVTVYSEDTTTERLRIPKLKIRPFNRTASESSSDKLTNEEIEKKINEAVEVVTKIETIEEIRIVTERPRLSKKLVHKRKKAKKEQVEKHENEVTENESNSPTTTSTTTTTTTTTSTTTTEKPEEVVEENDADEPEPPLIGIRGISSKEVNDNDTESESEEEPEEPEDPEPTPHPARPKVRPILTRRPTATRRPFKLLTQHVTPEAKLDDASPAPADGQSTTRKKFVRRRYKKVDYKNGTIEKFYVGPSVEVDPAIRQAKLNAATTEAPDLPTPIIHGRTTKRGRLTPKRLVGRTTSVRPKTAAINGDKVDGDTQKPLSRRLIYKRPVLKNFDLNKVKVDAEQKENIPESSSAQPAQSIEETVEVTTEDEEVVKEKPSENEINFQRKPYLQKTEEPQLVTEEAQNSEDLEEEKNVEKVKVYQRRPVLKNVTPKEDTQQKDADEENIVQQTTRAPQRRLVLKKRIQKNNEEDITDNVEDEKPKQPPRRTFQGRPLFKTTSENTNKEESENTSDQTEVTDERAEKNDEVKPQQPPRRVFQRRPVQKSKDNNTVEEHSTIKPDSTNENVDKEAENDEEEVVQTTTRRFSFRKPVQNDFEASNLKKENEKTETDADQKENAEEKSNNDEEKVTKLPPRRVLLKRPVHKTQIDENAIEVDNETTSVHSKEVESTDKNVTEKETSTRRISQRRPVQKKFNDQEDIEITTEFESKEVTKTPPRRVLLRRPTQKTPKDENTAEEETESVEDKTEVVENTRAPPRRVLQRRPVQNKFELSTAKVENPVETESGESSTESVKESTDENLEDEDDDKTRRTSTSRNIHRRPGFVKFEPTKQRKFIKKLKAIRERPTTTTEAPTTEFIPTDEESTETEVFSTEPAASSTESSSLNVETSELSTTTVSTKLVKNLKENKDDEPTVDDKKLTNEKEEIATKDTIEVDSENEVTSKPGVNRFDTISRAPFPIRRRTNTSRATSRPLNERFHRPRPLQENTNDEEEQNEVQRAPTSRSRLQSRRRPQEPKVEEAEKADEEQDNETIARRPNPSRRVSAARNGSRFQSRRKPLIEEDKDTNQVEEKTKNRINFENEANENNEKNTKDEAEVKKSSANSELLRRRGGSRRTQPTVVSRFNSRTESTSTVKEEKVEKTTSVVFNQPSTEVDNNEEVTEVPVVEEVSEENENDKSSSTTKEEEESSVSSTTLESSTNENELPQTTSTTLKSITEGTSQQTSTTLKPTTERETSSTPKASTFEQYSTTLRTTNPTFSTTTYIPRRRVPSTTTTTSTTFATDLEAFNQLVKQKHQEVIENVVSGFRGRQFVSTIPTTALPTRVSTTSPTFKPSPTFSSSPVHAVSRTPTPIVKFFIQDDSYYSLNPSRTFVPQVPFLSDAFRQILTDPPSRVVQQLPIDSETNINDDLTVRVGNSNSASRFRVTAPTQPPVYLSTVGQRQTPSVYTTTTFTSTQGFPHSFRSSQSTNLPLSSSVDVSHSSFPTPTNRFQSFSSTTRTVPTTTPTFRTHQPQRPAVNRQSFSNQIHTETIDLSPRMGPNRGRGGKRFNQNELKWNSEIWSLQGEDQGYYNFIKY
ncbi:mucin-2-like [Culicoides brevitarsis]|uniref:mucin-2-like n=1 Tax=Culicoides brevitarsis TaxID=469753 RepID=UPI00307CB929